MGDYAVIQAGGKQYRVAPGDILDVEKVEAPVGSTVTLEDVGLLVRDGQALVGAPRVEGAAVVAEVVEQFKGPKVTILKYKAKTRYRRKRGHRQRYTRLRILDIKMDR